MQNIILCFQCAPAYSKREAVYSSHLYIYICGYMHFGRMIPSLQCGKNLICGNHYTDGQHQPLM